MKSVSLYDSIRPIIWTDAGLKLLDQRLLPEKHQYELYTEVEDVAQAITDMVVRGAPAIGVTAAFGVVLAARKSYMHSPKLWQAMLHEDMEKLKAARPTAVNLAWAVDRMRLIADNLTGDPSTVLLTEAQRILTEDIAANHRMGEFGAKLMTIPGPILTHCNAGALATGGYGTALGVVRSGFANGKITRVYADETRPWLQGARLTAWEMIQEKIPVTLLADSAAAWLLKRGEIKWVIVGSDRIAANGDVANKIGTYSTAILAKHHNVKFMVVAPTSTIDMQLPTGNDIPIESRAKNEILGFSGKTVAATGADAWNPVFDVTPAEFVDVIVTEKGIIENPNHDKMIKLMHSRANI